MEDVGISVQAFCLCPQDINKMKNLIAAAICRRKVDKVMVEDHKETKIRRILCLDGGGIKGAYAASFLAAIDEKLEHPINQYFDLIVGTSAGGFIALGLGSGMSTKEIRNLFVERGKEIFPFSNNKGMKWLKQKLFQFRGVFRPQKQSQCLKKVLDETFYNKQLGESENRLVIPAWGKDTRRVHLYKTSHHERLQNDYREFIVDIAMATAAAPSYFAPYTNSDGQTFIDGGVYANNPIAIAAVESISILNWNPNSLHILSLGSPWELPPLRSKGYSLLFPCKVADLFLHAQSESANGMASLILGDSIEKNRIFRYAPQGNPKDTNLYDMSKVEHLIALGKSDAREKLPLIKDIFFTEPAKKFSPEHNIGGQND